MGKKSTKTNKTIFQTSREEAGLTRESASELLQFISSDRIERIENEKTSPSPEEVLAMAKAYNKPNLCNMYCARLCPIGQEYVPEVEVKDLPLITLETLSLLNSVNKDQQRLIEIAADGKITDDELADFYAIKEKLNKISLCIDALHLWVDTSIASGEMNSL